MKVSMIPDNSVKMIHASQNDVGRRWEFELYDEDGLIDVSSVEEQMIYPVYQGGTEQILPENTSTPATSPILADIVYPDELREEQEFLYRECPSVEDGQARIKRIVGNTVKFNQLNDNSVGSATTAGITKTLNSDGSWTLVGTTTQNNAFGNICLNRQIIQGHKYLIKGGTPQAGLLLVSAGSGILWGKSTSNPFTSDAIETAAGTFDDVAIRWQYPYATGTVVNTRQSCMFIDLTAMGIDNLTTVAEVEAWLSSHIGNLDYYAYNQGTLIPFMGEQIKTTGKNLLSSSWEQGSINGTTGELTVSTQRIRTADFISLFAGTYTLKLDSWYSFFVFIYELDGTFIERIPSDWDRILTFTLTANRKIKIIVRKSNLDILPSEISNTNIQLEVGSTASSYEEYKESIVNLPTTDYFADGMKSAGSVFDELTENLASKRVGKVDLGTQNWTYSSANNYFCLDKNYIGMKLVNNSQMICSKYPTTDNGGEGTIYDTASSIRVQDSNYTTVAAFKQMLTDQNVVLYFELAEPVETPIASASLVSQNQEIPMSVEDDKLVAYSTSEITEQSGFHDAKIKLSNDGVAYSAKFTLHVERKP